MEQRSLGKSAIRVPVIGMGTAQTFDTTEDRTPIVKEAMEAGISLFDSSPMYGHGEATLARGLGGRRGDVVIATKIFSPDAAEGKKQAERALAMYGGTVDIYQVHNMVNWQEQLPMLEALKAEGKVKAVGVTMGQKNTEEEITSLMRTGRIDMVQVRYNPVRRFALNTILPLAADLGIGVLTMQPLKEGVMNARPTAAELQALGVKTWAQAVLKWVASDRRVSCVLTATRTPGRPTENAAAGDSPWFDNAQRDLVVDIVDRTAS